jgi:hypothetical protein
MSGQSKPLVILVHMVRNGIICCIVATLLHGHGTTPKQNNKKKKINKRIG